MDSITFFNDVASTLKKNKELPDILDYTIPGSSSVDIDTLGIHLISELNYGGSEGVYLDLWIEFVNEEREYIREKFGTFKTLKSDLDAMKEMGTLLGAFTARFWDYVNDNYEEFNKRGYRIEPYGEGWKRLHWSYPSVERENLCERINYCLNREDNATKDVKYVIATNNKTGDSITIKAAAYPIDEELLEDI